MSYPPAPMALQRWIFRHRRTLRAGCAVLGVAALAWSVSKFASGNAVEGAISLGEVFVFFFSVPYGIRNLERYVLRHEAPPPPQQLMSIKPARHTRWVDDEETITDTPVEDSPPRDAPL